MQIAAKVPGLVCHPAYTGPKLIVCTACCMCRRPVAVKLGMKS